MLTASTRGLIEGPYDLLCFGSICADLRLSLPRFPRPGDGLRVREAVWAPGGNALNEARALTRWGARVALMGDLIGGDEPGAMLATALAEMGLDALVRRDSAARSVVCHILLTPDGQRTILALRPDGPPPPLPPVELLRSCRLVSVSRFGPRAAEVAALAREAGCIVLAGDALSPGDGLARHADVIVTSAHLLSEQAPGIPVDDLMAALHAARGAAVIVTDGPRPARALWSAGGRSHHAEAIPPTVAVVDTTGAGDQFRAGIAWGLLRGWAWPESLAFACETAAHHVAGLPS